LDPDVFDYYSRDLKKLHDNFIRNPNFTNAHKLQSDIGSELRYYVKQESKGTLNSADRNAMQELKEAHYRIKNDNGNFLSSKDPNLQAQYQNAARFHATKVAPYKSNPRLHEIASGEITNPGPQKILSIFKNPEEEEMSVLQDMGPTGSNAILHSALANQQINLTPERLSKALEGLSQKGLADYKSEQLNMLHDQLKRRLV